MDAQADEKRVTSKLDEVTLFFNGAELKHSSRTTLTTGENEILITNISTNVDPNSINVGVDGGAMISSYEHSFVKNENESPENEKLRKQIEECMKKIQKIDIDTKVLKQSQTLLEAGFSQKLKASDKGLSLDELMKLMDYFREKNNEIEHTIVANGEEKTKINNEITKLNGELRKQGQYIGVLKVKITSPKSMECKLAVSYCTYAAGWTPYYNINVESTDKPIQIISKAKVTQNTGFDWKQVKLTLSTGVPNNGKVAPVFNTWFLQEFRPTPRAYQSKAVMNSYDAARPEVMFMEESIDNDVALKMDDYLIVADNALVVNYTIDLPYNIPGNGVVQNIDLRTQYADAKYNYYCAPKLDTQTYLLAELSDNQNLDLPQGAAQISYDGMYLGETFIDGNSTLNNLTLTLGTDKRVSVKREKVNDVSSKNILGSYITQNFVYKITVKNNQSKEIKLVLKDQYPTSTLSNVTVELLKTTTKPTSDNSETGVLTWEDTFKAGQTKIYTVNYSVKYPKDMNLNL